MAPKKDVPSVTAATVAAGLAVPEPNQKQAALLQLAGPSFSTSQAISDIVQQGIPDKLVELVQYTDKSVKLLACRQVATYAAAGPEHPLKQAVASVETTEVLWSILHSYAESEGAIRAALADPAAVKAAAPKKLPGAKDPVDPDEWLPGPSKYLLEAALRALSSLAACTAAADLTDSAEGCATPAASWQQPYCAWMLQQEPSTVVCLLQHTSSRVQMRALRLALQLSRSEAWCAGCTAAGGTTAAVQLAGLLGTKADSSTGSNPGVQLAALQLLMRQTKVSHVAAAAVLASRRQVLDGLMGVILAAGLPWPVTPAGGPKKAAAGPDAAKQGIPARDTAVLIQQAAADLLALLCATDSQTCQLLVTANGLTALASIMPDPPTLPGADPTSQQAQPADASSSSGSGSGSTGGQGDGQVAAGKAAAVPALSLVAAPEDTSAGAAVPSPRRQQGAGTPRSRRATPPGGQYVDTPPPFTGFTTPGTKLYYPQLQAKVLHVIAAVLSQPGAVTAVLEACPQLPRLLLHMFAVPPAAVTDDADPSRVSGTGAAGAAAADTASAAAGKGVPGTPTAGAAAAKAAPAGVQTPRGSVAVNPARGPAAAGAQVSSSGGATPRKTMVAGGAAVAKAPEPAASDPLGPPYAACTKAAALACLRHLAHDKQAAALLASYHAFAASTNPAAAEGAAVSQSTPATARQWTEVTSQEQQQQKAQTGSSRSQGPSMLQQVLVDIQAMGAGSIKAAAAASEAQDSAGSGDGAHPSATAAETQPLPKQQLQQDHMLASLDHAASFIEGLLANLEEQQLLPLPLVAALQVLAKCATQQPTAHQLQQAVMRAMLSLPEDAFVPPPRPPLPSPPPTPPPPPLPTSQFAWDALDRPCVTDGAVVVSAHA